MSSSSRWLQQMFGVVCMVMIANLQYGWTLFVQPMHSARGWSVVDIQVAFSIVVVTAIMNFVVVGLALFVLRPLRARGLARSAQGLPAAAR